MVQAIVWVAYPVPVLYFFLRRQTPRDWAVGPRLPAARPGEQDSAVTPAAQG